MGGKGSGARPTLTAEDHRRRGTYVSTRHAHLEHTELKVAPKPSGVVKSSHKSQQRWVRSEADSHAYAAGCRFNERLAKHVADFFLRYLCFSKGQWAGSPFELDPWQRDNLIYPLFGWVRPNGTRRYRRTYIEIPKKQGKSTLASGIGLYMLVADEEPGCEVYSLGADRDQASIVHREAIHMVEASPELKSNLQINRTTGTISYEATRSYYRALSATPRGKHGINIHCGIADELHEWYGSDLWHAIKYGYRARRQPLQFVITNAGNDMESICRQQHDKAQGILDGKIFDDTFFPLICQVSREEAEQELQSVKNGATELTIARKCNPGLGHIVQEEDLLNDIKDALQTPREIPNLLRLTYGIWATGEAPWLDADKWAACGRDYTVADLEGQECYLGLDLSQVHDMTAVVLAFPEGENVKLLPFFWLPEEEAKAKDHLASYMEWAKGGHIELISGSVIENEVIFQRIKALSEQFQIKEVVYDRMYAGDLTARVENELFVERTEFPQTIMHFAGPCADFERMMVSGQLQHNNHPILNWQAGHVQLKTDPNQNRRPVKPKREDYRAIDGIVAALMALSQAVAVDDPEARYEPGDLVFAGDDDDV